MWGTLATGLFATATVNSAVAGGGLVYGHTHLFLAELAGIAVVASFAFVGSYVLLRAINHFTPLRAAPANEDAGLDVAEFGEFAYDPGGGARAEATAAPGH